MSIHELLFEATPFSYIATTAASTASGDDLWYFVADKRTIAVKANSVKKPNKIVPYYKGHHWPMVFSMFEILDNGKTKKTLPTIPSPAKTIATAAEIIANEVKSNKQCNAVVVRFPASMGRGGSLGTIIGRYLKKTSVPFGIIGSFNTGEKGMNYIILTRNGKQLKVTDVFQMPEDQIAKLSTSEVAELTDDDVSMIADKVEKQVNRIVPSMIKLSTVVGGSDVPVATSEFLKTNPHTLGTVDVSKLPQFKFKDLFPGITAEPDNPFLTSESPTTESKAKMTMELRSAISINSMADGTEAREYAAKIVEFGLTMNDYTNNTDKLGEVRKFVSEEITANEKETDNIMSAIFTGSLVDNMSDTITNAYASYKPKIDDADEYIVDKYCGSAYSIINGVFMHGITGATAEKFVGMMDKAFERSGVRLDPKFTVYRGSQLSSSDTYDTAVGKLFHFRSYVSTSLNPRVGFTFGGNDKHELGTMLSTTKRRSEFDETEPMAEPMAAAFVISGLDKIPVIVPGRYSPYERECEVILPRGTTVRIEDMSTAMHNKSKNKVTNVMFICKGVAPSEISINEAVYDGDEFATSGRLVEFSSFNDKQAIISEEKKAARKSEDILRSATAFVAAINNDQFTKQMSKKEKQEMERIAAKYCSQIL